jgi:2-octaprenyl-6-methoxyphenol hydroxylase
MHNTDLLIAGGGYNGLALACAVKQNLGEEFSITLVDPRLKASTTDKRAFLLAAGAIRFLKTLGVWEALAPNACCVDRMVITDSKLQDPIRQSLLSFEGEVAEGEPFGFMVAQGALNEALLSRAKTLGVNLIEGAFNHYSETPFALTVTLESKETIKTPLLIGADGANSQVRKAANIQTIGYEYDAAAIVCTIKSEKPHHGTAYEHFLPQGPFATLPLNDNQASLVWTESKSDAQKLLSLPAPFLLDELNQRFGSELGEIALLDKPRMFPLSLMLARDFVKNRVALIGDAAHVIHPIAGQGVNLGLKDVEALCTTLCQTARLGLDYGTELALEPYQTLRRTHTTRMALTTDALNRLFSNNNDALRIARGFGLNVVDRLIPLKKWFIKEAAGV